MNIETVTDQLSVSEQIQVADVKTLADLGVEILVCNRPDNEADDQTSFADIANAAEALGIKAVSIPFKPNEMTPQDSQAFAELLKNHGRMHAYCRTGNRSKMIFTAATQN
jgi:sulfide:quinone oxidoreductase